MSPELSKQFEKEFRIFKKELKKVVEEVNYPYIKVILEINLNLIKSYPLREKGYQEKGFI